MKEYKIDANKKSLGRVAGEAAVILRGKNSPDFAPNRVPDIKLIVVNLDRVKITGKKMEQKKYKSFSGYPGGLKITNMKEIVKKKGIEYVFRNAVKGMLPKNKLKEKIMRNLKI